MLRCSKSDFEEVGFSCGNPKTIHGWSRSTVCAEHVYLMYVTLRNANQGYGEGRTY